MLFQLSIDSVSKIPKTPFTISEWKWMISVEEKDETEMRNAKEHDRMALHRKL